MAEYTYKTNQDEDDALESLSDSSGSDLATVFQALVTGVLTAQVEQQKQAEFQILKGESLADIKSAVQVVTSKQQADQSAQQVLVLQK